ncbi:MAG: 2-amino-4-hydroxy-6-hydroxymethyldihydropteridine diphosphokinase [Phycisphaeraceae bacterium]|nr:2-amino-4-hydroxy-6-hydroxymethyldihydropteridine diphosphokinase [Phycisphaeraceae bacterium]
MPTRLESTAYVAMGSNLGDRLGVLLAALSDLAASPGIVVRAVSTVIETDPVGPSGQGRYLNAVVQLETSATPHELLERLLVIERKHGRDRTHGSRWGPRTLDLDLLLYDDRIIAEPGLTVPHPRMTERPFVLEPLAEIAGDRVIPTTGCTVHEHLEACRIQMQEADRSDAREARSSQKYGSIRSSASESMLRVLAICAAMFIGLIASGIVEARPPSGGAPIARSYWRAYGADAILMTLIRGYRAGPIAESMEFHLDSPSGSSRAVVVVRMDAGDHHRPARLRVETDDLILAAVEEADRTRVLAVHPRDTLRYVEWVLDDSLSMSSIRRVLPPLPLPGATLALGDNREPLLPAAGESRWFLSKRSDLPSGVVGLISVNSLPSAAPLPMEVLIDTVSWRLARVQAAWPSRAGETLVTINLKPIDPGQPEIWDIIADGRQRVESAADFRPIPALLVPGDVVDLTRLNTWTMQPWNVAREFSPGTETQDRPIRGYRYAAFVVYPWRAEGQTDHVQMAWAMAVDAAEAIALMSTERHASGQSSVQAQLLVRPLCVFDPSEFSRQRVSEEFTRWGSGPESSPLLWSTARDALLTNHAEDIGFVLLVDSSWKMILSVPLIDGNLDAPQLSKRLIAAIERHAWPPAGP